MFKKKKMFSESHREGRVSFTVTVCPSHLAGTCRPRVVLWSSEPGGVSPRTARCARRLAASSGRTSSSAASSCGSKERADSWECPPETRGSTRPSAHRTDGSWTEDREKE